MTLLVALLMVPMSLFLGILVGRLRGFKTGIATGLGVLVAGALAFVVLLGLSLPM